MPKSNRFRVRRKGFLKSPRVRTIGAIAVLAVAVAGPAPASEPAWRAVTGGAFPAPPAVSTDGTVYVASEDRYLYAFAPHGQRLWRYDLRVRPSAGLCALPGGLVAVERSDGTLVVVNPAAKAVWSRPGGAVGEDAGGGRAGGAAAGGGRAGGAAAGGGRAGGAAAGLACTASGLLLRLEEGNVLRALTPRGRPLWTLELGEAVSAGPEAGSAIAGRRVVYLADVSGRIRVVSDAGRSGSQVQLPDPAVELAAIPDGGVVARTASGALYLVVGGEAKRLPDPAGEAPILAMCVTEDGVASLAAGGALLFLSFSSNTWETLATGIAVGRGRQEEAAGTGSRPRRGAGLAAAGAERLVVTGADWTVSQYRVTLGAGSVSTPPAPPAEREGVGRQGAEPDGNDSIYFSRMLSSREATERKKALDEIETRLRDGALAGSYDYISRLLLETARSAPDGRDRGRALALAARMADTGIRNEILTIAREAVDREVRLAFLSAVPHIPIDGAGRTAHVVLRVLREELRDSGGFDGGTGSAPSTLRLGRAGLRAVEGYVSYRGGIDSPDVGAAVSLLLGRSFPREIRDTARALVRRLY